MRKAFFSVLAVGLCLMSCTPKSPQSLLTLHDKEIDKIIAQMTLEEKVQMFHSKTNMSSEGVPRFNIQDIKYADGPFGIREEGIPTGFTPAGWTTDSATYFPTGSALAATWSRELAYKYGHGMGTEGRKRGKDMILGPAINIQRLPVGGRTYEYLSEDPLLSGVLAAEYTKGCQDAGTAVCIKHYALNNQETNRGSVNVICDERTMREIYLVPFQMAVEEGGAMGLMPAYNKVNGYHCSENEHLLNEVLRGDWGFNGMTVSDWGATHSTMGAALHGLNVQMTGDRYLGPPLIDSVKAGKVPMEVIDQKAREILRVRFAIEALAEDECNNEVASQPESRQTAYEVASKSIVLLKNEGKLLPVSKDVKKIAVIGRNAIELTQAGGVGAGVKSVYEITPLQGLQAKAPAGVEIAYAPGYKLYAGRFANRLSEEEQQKCAATIDEAPDANLLAEAVALAKDADIVLYFCGTNKNIETEGSDRQDIMLPVGQDAIAEALAEANPNLVSIIIAGGPCDLNVVNKVSRSVVQGWQNGLEGGNALADVLYGNIAPSGKLPFTFPVKLEDSPAYALGNFPQKVETQADLFTNQYRQDIAGQRRAAARPAPDAYYSEGLYVGYRWFTSKNVAPMYEFGYGLSYVDFEYSNIKTNKAKYGAKDVIKVTFDLKNCGDMEADEVPQIYVHRVDAKVDYPVEELKAFDRITLAAGETKTVTLEIPVKSLRYWDEAINGWNLENGQVELLLGASSEDIRLKAQVNI